MYIGGGDSAPHGGTAAAVEKWIGRAMVFIHMCWPGARWCLGDGW